MALQRDTRYPGRWTTGNAAHPQGAFKNRTAPGSLDGSYIEQDWANDWDGYFASLLNAAGMTANGTVDAVGASQYFTALKTIINLSGSIVGQHSALSAVLTTAGTSATFTADEVATGTALGGVVYKLTSYSKVLNLATTGAGGMDVGTAPVSGYVAIYAIYNPITGVSSILATNATAAAAPTVYGGANMPAGYTASALLTVLGTNASSQFKPFVVQCRDVYIQLSTMFQNATSVTNQVASVAGLIPKNAKTVSGQFFGSSSAASALNMFIQPDTTTIGQASQSVVVGASAGLISSFSKVPLITAQQIVVTTSSSAGTPTFIVYATGYSI